MTENPYREDVEASLCGAIIRHPDVIPDIISLVSPRDFFNARICAIYCCCIELYGEGEFPSLAGLGQRIFDVKDGRKAIPSFPYDQNTFDKIDPFFITQIYDVASTAEGSKIDAKIIRDRGVRRQLEWLGIDIPAIVKSAPDFQVALDTVESRLIDIAAQTCAGEVVTQSVAVHQFDEHLEKVMSGAIPPGLDTGLLDLDELVCFRQGELVLVAARPSVGKTALALHFVRHFCKKGLRVMFFSMEQDKKTVIKRIVSAEGSIHGTNLSRGELSEVQRERYFEVRESISNWNVFWDDTPGQQVQSLVAKSRKVHLKNKLDAIVIDYVQLIKMHGNQKTHEKIGEVSKRLKQLARELSVPVITLAQFNRDADSTNNAPPRLSQLKGSGDLEQDADTVLALHRDDSEPGNQGIRESILIELNVLKQREGPTGDTIVVYRKPFTRFENMQPDPHFPI